MNLIQQIDADVSQAAKSKDALVLLTLRQLKNAIANAEIANKRETLSEEAIIKVLKSEAKKRREAIGLYQKGNRPELAEKEQKEVEIISNYLPPEMSEVDIVKQVEAVIVQIGAVGPQDTGKVMGAVMAKLGGQADGTVVSRIVAEQLTAKK